MYEQKELQALDSLINEKHLDKDMYITKEFWMAQLSFSLLTALKEFVHYTEENQDKYMIMSKNNWLNFLQEYYNHLNCSKNILVDILRGNTPSNMDVETLKESLLWGFKISKNIFRPREEGKKPFVFDSILAGKYYNSLFYYIKYIECKVEMSLSLLDKVEEKQNILNLVQNERKNIEEIEVHVKQNEEDLNKVETDKQLQIAGMWYRTLDFIEKQVPKEESIIKGEKEFEPPITLV